MIWGLMILISPLAGRIGCGWICFMGTIQDFAGQVSLYKVKWNKPVLLIRIFMIVAVFASALTFFFIHLKTGKIDRIQINPGFLNMDLNAHYKHVWLYNTVGAVIIGILLERRFLCRNVCFMGAICAGGATYSRLIPVIEPGKCNLCGKCEKDCLVRIPMMDYVKNNHGLITSSECIICGKCIESCNSDAITIKIVWSRKRYLSKLEPN